MTDEWRVGWTHSDDRDDRDEFWGRDFDIQDEIREAKTLRIILDGADTHRKLEGVLSRLDDRELTDVALSWLDLPPQIMEPFEMVDETTLARVLEIPEARELSELVASVARFLLSFYCAAVEEQAGRIERGTGTCRRE